MIIVNGNIGGTFPILDYIKTPLTLFLQRREFLPLEETAFGAFGCIRLEAPKLNLPECKSFEVSFPITHKAVVVDSGLIKTPHGFEQLR